MRVRDLRNVLFGVVVGVAGVKLRPAISKVARPALRTLTAAVIELSLQARAAMARTREDIENIVAEAEYERGLSERSSSAAQPSAPSNGSLDENLD